jgi:plastocyanin
MRVLGCVAVAAALAVYGPAAPAAELVVHVVDTGAGQPAADAVVTLVPSGPGPAPKAAPAAETRIIDQKNETFIPYVQIVRPGDPVVFRNSDNTRHHVYSFARIKTFEFVLSPGESSQPMQIDQTGIAVVGCNIHDNMINYLFVSDAPWIAQTGADGIAKLEDVPPGAYQLHLWHPQLHPGTPEIAMPVAVDGQSLSVRSEIAVSLLPDPRQRMDHEHMRY